MIDVAKDGIVGVSYYTYDTQGNQTWIIGPGTVNGNVFEIDFEITAGGIYGPDFDPLLVNRYPWGTGIFTFSSCYGGKVEITPNQDYADQFETVQRVNLELAEVQAQLEAAFNRWNGLEVIL